MDITQTLMNEHQNILRVMRLVEQECSAINKGKAINADFFSELFDFIAIYVDKFHHGKEEDILFDAMVKNAENLHCNPVPVMLHEHDSGRYFLSEMRKALTLNDAEKLISASYNYIELLSNHIYKEDNVLYPMAEEALSLADKQSINQQYQQAEARVSSAFNIEALKEFGL